MKIWCGLLKELQFVINFIPLFPDCFTTSIPTWADQISTKKQVRSLRVCACVCACMKLWSWLQPYVMATPWRPVTFFTFIDWSDPVALRWRWTFMCRPMTPTSHLTSISGPNFHSHSRQVLSFSLSLVHVCMHSPVRTQSQTHFRERVWCDGAAKSNLASYMKPVVTVWRGWGRCKSHNCVREWAPGGHPRARLLCLLPGLSPMLLCFPFQYHSRRVASLEPDRM